MFFDVVKYSNACEKAYNLKPGTIVSFYYNVLELENNAADINIESEKD